MPCPLERYNLLIRSCHDVSAVPGSPNFVFLEFVDVAIRYSFAKNTQSTPDDTLNLSGRRTTL